MAIYDYKVYIGVIQIPSLLHLREVPLQTRCCVVGSGLAVSISSTGIKADGYSLIPRTLHDVGIP